MSKREYLWLTYCPYEGWELHDTEAEGRERFAQILSTLKDEAATEGYWHDDTHAACLVRATRVVSLLLEQTDGPEDDTPGGEKCRANGIDGVFDVVVKEEAKNE